MSLVSNFIGGVSGIGGNGAALAPNFDLNDTTFSDLLEKQIKGQDENSSANGLLGSFGIPAGMQIDGMDGTEFTEKAFDQAEALGAKTDGENEEENQNNNIMDLNNDGDVTSSEMLTFFTSLLDNGSTGQEARSELFDFARRQATDFYNQHSKNVITNLTEFVDDIKGLV